MRTWMAAALLLGALVACRDRDLGSGINTVDRNYAKPTAEVWAAAKEVANDADFEVKSDAHDDLGGELVARRGTGQEVRFLIKAIDRNNTSVSIRVEPGDRELATELHERLAKELGLGAATGGIMGGSSTAGVYPASLAEAQESAREVFNLLDITSSTANGSTHRIAGRMNDGMTVAIEFEERSDQKTQVTFLAGSEKSQHARDTALRLKSEFEKQIKPEPAGNKPD